MSRGGAERWRFRLLRGVVLAAALCLVLRVVWIQVVQHDMYLEIARDQWWDEGLMPAERGDIHDRFGRPLALSVITWRIGVAPGQPGDTEAMCRQLGEVLDCSADKVRRQISGARRHVVLDRGVVLTRAQKQALTRFPAVTMDTLRSRVYPADGVGAALIGFCRQDPDTVHATGLEHSLRGLLAGRSGRYQAVATGVRGQDLGRVVLQEPVHGRSVTLTLDMDLQAISERRLAESVAETGARGGSVLILDPDNGDVLAAASWPLLPKRAGRHPDAAVWNNRNFTGIFEPGSVFKIFSTASLLRHAAIDTQTVFNCSDHRFQGFQIRNDDDHKYGPLPLMRAFAKSSNIYFARAVANLNAHEFHRDLLDYGFGQATALPYAGQPAGIVHDPATWSGRSKATMAIGQEIAVTPLQLGLAVCAVANGGTLYAPRLVSEVRDHDGNLVRREDPAPLRRIMAEPLTAVLREAMARVVREGTGVAARLDWIETGGKTGTAQKSRDGRTFTAGAYVASFAGIAPVADPRLVILTVLDEPRGIHHYASQSAVPLFRRIIEDVRHSTSWLTGAAGGRTGIIAARQPAKRVTVPDLLQLTTVTAAERLAAAGLLLEGGERDGVVVEQVPAAGSRCAPGTGVRLVVAGRGEGAAPVCPDFAGLSNRQVRSLAGRLGLRVNIRGAGYAVRQEPPPGRVPDGGLVTVRMEEPWR